MARSPSPTTAEKAQNAPPTPATDPAAANGSVTAPRPRKRRRVMSCRACQRVKCRCEYDALAQTCRRCQNLRVACSLAGEGPTAGPTAAIVGSVEDRLRQHDAALAEIKGLLQVLVQGVRQPVVPVPVAVPVAPTPAPAPPAAAATPAAPPPRRTRRPSAFDPEQVADPADQDIGTAPIVVVRARGPSMDGGRRRLPQQAGLDLVQLGVLDPAAAQALFGAFLQYGGSHLIVYDRDDAPAAQLQQQLRSASPFLYSVACLMGFRYGVPAGAGLPPRLHRDVYEGVRRALGQVLLVSPLPLDEVNALLIVSACGSAPVRGPPSAAPGPADDPEHPEDPDAAAAEYMDGWLLSGDCVQHAMLSIHFSAIVARVQRGCATRADGRALRLWCHICVNHLQWAAMTGRPPIVAPHYLRQCTALLNVYHATLQDGMTVATALLYSILHRKLAAAPPRGALARDPPAAVPLDADDADGFAAWRARWRHLFTLPRASLLTLSYFAARLIYATRVPGEPWVEAEALFPASAASPAPAAAAQSGSVSAAPADGTATAAADRSQLAACRYAALVVQTHVAMEPALLNEISTQMMMCVVYASLLLAHNYQHTALPCTAVHALLVAQRRQCQESAVATPLLRRTVREALRVVEGQMGGGGETPDGRPDEELVHDVPYAQYRHVGPETPSDPLPQPAHDTVFGASDPGDAFPYAVDADAMLSDDAGTIFSMMERYFAGAYGPLDEMEQA